MRRVLGDIPYLEDQVKSIIESVDADGSGTIDFDEFLDLMSDPRFNDLAKDEHRQAFEMFDKDGSGHISVAELKEAFSNLGELSLNLSSTSKSHRVIHVLFYIGQRLDDDEFDAILRMADLDGDQHINYEEFLEVSSCPAFLFVVCTGIHHAAIR